MGSPASTGEALKDSSHDNRTEGESPVLRFDRLGQFGFLGGSFGGCGASETSSGGSHGSPVALIQCDRAVLRSEFQGRLSLTSLDLPPGPDPLEMLDPPKSAC